MGIKFKRLLAVNIDGVISILIPSLIFDILQRVINYIFFHEFSAEINFDLGLHLFFHIVLLIFYLYSMYFLFVRKDTFFKGGSLGKKLCRLLIVNHHDEIVVDKKILISRVKENINNFILYPAHILTNVDTSGDIKYKTKVIKK